MCASDDVDRESAATDDLPELSSGESDTETEKIGEFNFDKVVKESGGDSFPVADRQADANPAPQTDDLLKKAEIDQHTSIRWPLLFALALPTIAIGISELLLFVDQPELALWGHLLTLLACVFASVRFQDWSSLLQVFALVPLFRLVNLGMPTFFELTIYFFPLVYAPLLPAIYVIITEQDISIGVNSRAFVLLALPGTAIAAVLAWMEYQIIAPAALIPQWSLEQLVVLAVVQIGFVALVEELLFRGILQRKFGEYMNRWAGVVLASALFGMMHSIYGSGLEIVVAGFIGFVFGVIYEWTDSIGLVTFMHGILNVFLFGIIPIHGAGSGIV